MTEYIVRVDRYSLRRYYHRKQISHEELIECVHAHHHLQQGWRIVLTADGKDAATAVLDSGVVREEALVVGLDGQTQI